MSPTWSETKAKAKAARNLSPEAEAARQARVDAGAAQMLATAQAYRLAEMRKSQGLTQVEVAAAMGVTQAWVSEIENGQLGTTGIDVLRRYVEALGGTLEVVANFGGTRLLAS